MSDGILLFIEQRDGALNRTSLEALVAAQGIAATSGDKISAVVFGKGVGNVAAEVAGKKLETVYTVEDDKLAEYTPDGYVAALKQVVERLDPKLVIFSHTYQVRDFAPRLAAALGKTFVTDCVAYRADGSDVVFTRQIFQGKINTDVRVTGEAPILASFQAGSYRADKAEGSDSAASITALEINLSDVQIRSEAEPKFQEAKQAVDLSQAPLIVAVGRGIKSQENIEIVQKLADAMGAEIAASRPICDNEWLPWTARSEARGRQFPRSFIWLSASQGRSN